MVFEKEIATHEQMVAKALSMGGEKKLAKRKEQNVLNARERLGLLFDDNTFFETGLFATSANPADADKTPGDAKLTGFGKINGRKASAIANDFTVKGASSSTINGKKMEHMKSLAKKKGIPLIFLGESTGARMPDVMGAKGIGGGSNPIQYIRQRETPWVSAVLGHCYGSSSWYTVMSDFVVMRKGSIMAVSSPALASLATREEVDPEDLGGWRLHSDVTGIADVVVNTDEEAIEMIKKYLSYMPSHHNEAPPRLPVPEGSDDAVKDILELIPESRTKVYDVRKVIKAVVDKDSYFELKARFGKSIVTAFSRIDGRSVGIIANNPLNKGGAIDADAADKATSFIVQCDSFNIPIVFLVDQPGFLIGIEAEKKRMPGKVMNWMNALSLCTVPKISIILRKTYGQAVLNMGGSGNADEVAAWWTADVGFMDPYSGVTIVHGIKREDNPELFDKYLAEMAKDTSAYSLAAIYGAQNVIDPRETRDYLKNVLEVHESNLTNGVGEHLMRNWPTTF
ncbi:carboxyl transferase domain-containing protein [Neobacillus niacini]|uniref:acyl-CoA carboxylase subunit beta n=1 Tax=Neobacillus niacini TaxID=86668 RepID=UPI00300015AC